MGARPSPYLDDNTLTGEVAMSSYERARFVNYLVMVSTVNTYGMEMPRSMSTKDKFRGDTRTLKLPAMAQVLDSSKTFLRPRQP